MALQSRVLCFVGDGEEVWSGQDLVGEDFLKRTGFDEFGACAGAGGVDGILAGRRGEGEFVGSDANYTS